MKLAGFEEGQAVLLPAVHCMAHRQHLIKNEKKAIIQMQILKTKAREEKARLSENKQNERQNKASE